MRAQGLLVALVLVLFSSLFGHAACTPGLTVNTVTICSPAAGATVTSPVSIQAAVNSTAAVQFTQIYVDGVKAFEVAGSGGTTSIAMAAGQHRITVQAFNGAFIKQTETINVTAGSGCVGGPTNLTVTVCTPANGATVASPVHIAAATTSSTPVTFIQIYVDLVKTFNAPANSVDTSLDLAAGAHRITVQAGFGTTVFKQTINVTVSGGTTPPPPTGAGVHTYQYNNSRTGANTSETTLTPANVNSTTFGKKGSWTVDGTMFTQPLFLPGVDIPGKGTFNVVFVATEHDSVYALNADAPGSAPLWKTNFTDSAAGITTVPSVSGTGRTALGPEVGITGTPVIDSASGTLYVSAMTEVHGVPQHHFHALDIHTGEEKFGAPVLITATVNGIGTGHDVNNKITFHPITQNQRQALALANGVVYVSFASYSDIQPYHGWIFAFDASTKLQIAAFNVSPDTEGGGMWNAGSGPVIDSNGNLFVTTGDGEFATGDLGDSVLKLKLIGSSIEVMDSFTPFNQACINRNDLDFGSSTPVLLPTQAGTFPNELVLGSKEGRIYVLDRDNLGKFHTGSDSQIPQSILVNPTACGSAGFSADGSKRMYGSPAYWNGFIFIGVANGPLRQYKVSSGHLSLGAVTAYVYPASGQSGRAPLPMVTANGASNGIVWTSERKFDTGHEILRAFNASTMEQLYSSDTNGARDSLGTGTVFTVPMVQRGKLYVTSSQKLFVFGLLK